MPEVSVVVPTINEAGNIDALLSRIVALIDELPYGLEVVVVDDGST
ncbi:MAG TPA: glycosyltransferase, partial [Thermosynergistes sp.]|nr:glycosyltransferase [Thermosynergistes sp.]